MIDGGTFGDLTITAPGGKLDCSERERSSQPCCPPDDAPGARRFRLAPLLFGRGGAVHSPTGAEEWRGLRSSRAQAAGSENRDERSLSERLFRPSGPRPSSDGRDLATRLGLENGHLRYLRDLRFLPFGGWAWRSWRLCGSRLRCLRVFVSSCLRRCPPVTASRPALW